MSEIIRTSNNKTIEVFDNLLSFGERNKIFECVTNSLYRVGSSDGKYSKKSNQIASPYNSDDIETIGIFSLPQIKEQILSKYKFNQLVQSRINLSNCSEYNSPHLDSCRYTFLYYVNLRWEIEWGGQTLFLNETLDKVEYCSLYKPGKIIVFEGSIPHMIVSPTIWAEQHRFSFVLQFN